MSDYRLKDRPLVQSGIQPEIDAGIPTEGAAEARASAHPTLAARIAQRGRLRAERAARLARLRPDSTADSMTGSTPDSPPDSMPEFTSELKSGTGDAAPGIAVAPARGASPEPIPVRGGRAPSDAQLALEEFLRALTGAEPPPATRAAPRGAAAEVLPFQRQGETSRPAAPAPEVIAEAMAEGMPEASPAEPAPLPACDLDRLPGAGPGLVWALRRAGLRCLAEVARLDEAELATRLGPLGRLVPAATWIATAQAGSDLV